MKIKLFLAFLLINCTAGIIHVYAQDIPVLLRLKRSEQPDSLGCNVVEQVTKITYNLILQNKVRLWDSPAKEIQIAATSLKEIEKSTATNFVDEDIIFMYEKWTQSKRELGSKTIGITFFNKDAHGQEVSYGYVDYNDLREPMMLAKAETNANGNYGETMAYFLTTKRYNFNIVQFNNKVLPNVNESQRALAEFKGKLDFGTVASQYYDEKVKLVTYNIDNKSTTDSLKEANSKAIFKMFETYLSANKEEFFNMGGDKLQGFFNTGKQKLKITGIEVTEMWKKGSNNQLYYEPKSIRLTVNDSLLNSVPLSELIMMDLTVNEQKFILALLDKDFNFIITQINSQKIPKREAYLYYKGLQTYSWSQVMDYVKYY